MLLSKLTFGQEPAVRWAQRHSAGKFCHGDGRNLTWLPEADGWINRGLRQRFSQGHWLNQFLLIKSLPVESVRCKSLQLYLKEITYIICRSDVFNFKILKGLFLAGHGGVVCKNLLNIKYGSRNNHKLLHVLHSHEPELFNVQRLHVQETFDHVISYASIYHLEKDEQCYWAEQTSLGQKKFNAARVLPLA